MEGIVFLKMPINDQAICTVLLENMTIVEDLLDCHQLLDCYVTCGGKIANLDDNLRPGECYTICPRLRGGKGGFGSMLRAIGAQIEKTTNREACRDLSGRRMRDVNNEKKMVEYLEKKAEREREREKKKVEKLERLTQQPKHFFNDPDYDSKLHEAVENVDKAVEKGIVAYTKKRKANPNEKQRAEPQIKKGLWLGEEDISDSDSDEEIQQEAIAIKSRNLNGSESAACSSSQSDQPCSSNKEVQQEVIASKDLLNESESTPSGSSELNNPDLLSPIPSTANSVEKGDKIVKTAHNQEEEKQTLFKADEIVVGQNTNTQKINNESINNNSDPPETNAITIMESEDQVKEAQLKVIDENITEKKQTVEVADSDIDLSKYKSAEMIESLGLEVLKAILMKKGVKCGGSLKERAARLFTIKDLSPNEIDPSLLATNSKKRNRSKK